MYNNMQIPPSIFELSEKYIYYLDKSTNVPHTETPVIDKIQF